MQNALFETLACPRHPTAPLTVTATEVFCTEGQERYPMIRGVLLFGTPRAPYGTMTAELLTSAAVLSAQAQLREGARRLGLGKRHEAHARLIAAFAGLGPGKRALDLGCGLGHSTRALAAHTPGGGVVGFDMTGALSHRGVDTTADEVGFVEGDWRQLPFRRHAFDAVYCRDALLFTRDPSDLLQRIHTVLKPGGRLVVEAIAARRVSRLRGLQRAVHRVSGLRVVDTDLLSDQLREAGFEQREEVLEGASLVLAAVRV